ncbi:maleylpyruvate isomerase family mycothiol-dependent enzyme [Streptacidiphilus sp. 4-A2]|nr:maleylpyruvate isomerase family mycothiol-dependent enzyme [Streptacidiphilus sp. 4-A2]
MTAHSATPRPDRALAANAEAEERLLRSVRAMRPEQVFEPSALPGWTRGHLLAHLARNADGMVNLLTGARIGTPIAMYSSLQERDDGIEAGAKRPLPEQLADLRDSAARLAEAADAMPDHAWGVEVPHRLGVFPAAYVPVKRTQEIHYHLVDLALDCTPAEWPADFVSRELGPLTARHLESGVLTQELLDSFDATPAALLAWLSGRSDGSGLGVPLSVLPALPR